MPIMPAALSATTITSSSNHPFHDQFPPIGLVGRAISTEHATMSELYSGTQEVQEGDVDLERISKPCTELRGDHTAHS